MIKIVQELGDRLLTAIVPRTSAEAVCTPAERVCTCHQDVEGEYRFCYWEQLCNGVYREWGYHSIKGC